MDKIKRYKTFGLKSKEFAEETKTLAANQELYNGFLIIYACDTTLYGRYSTKSNRIMQGTHAFITLVVLLINRLFM